MKHGDSATYLKAATLIKEHGIGVFDALHVAFCGSESILSPDPTFQTLGLNVVRLAA